jgi:hypothetical protein
MLPAAYGPYGLLGREWDEASRRWQPFRYALDELAACFERHRGSNLWIRSDVLSPGLTAADEKSLTFAGLIAVQLGYERSEKLGDASISIVDRIRHEVTGRERRHAEYLRIFERLRRSMRKRLVVKTAYTFPDGSVGEHWRMTARAADAHVRGEVTFAAEPVGLRR